MQTRTAVDVRPAHRILATGLATSGAGVLAFATVHAFLIRPIWARALISSPMALMAGLTMAWAYDDLSARTGVQSIGSGMRFGLLLFLTLVPATLFENSLRVADLRLDGNLEMIVDLLLAGVSGAAACAISIPRTVRRPYVSFAAASIGLTMVMGGPIPVANSARAAWLFLAFLPICLLAATALVVARRAWFPTD